VHFLLFVILPPDVYNNLVGRHESPLISHFTTPSVLSNITQSRMMNQKGRADAKGSSKALILGGGAIGMNVKKHLDETGVIHARIFDPNIRACSSAASNESRRGKGVGSMEHSSGIYTGSADLEALIEESDIIIGASGKRSLHDSKFPLLKDGALLLSVSSSDRELSAPALRRMLPQTNDWNQRFQVPLMLYDENGLNDEKGRIVHLAYSGFPLTFEDRCSNAGEPDEMQLTMGLLIGSVAIGVSSYENGHHTACGLVDVDEELQNELIQEHIAQGVAEHVRHKYSMLAERELAKFA